MDQGDTIDLVLQTASGLTADAVTTALDAVKHLYREAPDQRLTRADITKVIAIARQNYQH